MMYIIISLHLKHEGSIDRLNFMPEGPMTVTGILCWRVDYDGGWPGLSDVEICYAAQRHRRGVPRRTSARLGQGQDEYLGSVLGPRECVQTGKTRYCHIIVQMYCQSA
jgi:hypothetical protein